MKIVLINKSDKIGGAAVACFRLFKALVNNNVSVSFLVQGKKSNCERVFETNNSFLKRKIGFIRFVIERLFFLIYEKSKEIRFAFSIANTGENISKHKLVKESDIIHIHWINQGFLSLKSIQKLLKTGKPVVWTLHDMWFFTGGCHYAGVCRNFTKNCGFCSFLKNPHAKDLSNKIWNRKLKLLKKNNIHFVACSKWLAGIAQQSSLLKNHSIINIPNPIDTELFKPIDIIKTRQKLLLKPEKKLILFAAANLEDKRKGLIYTLNALKHLATDFPETINDIELVVFGKSNKEIELSQPYPVINLGFVSDMGLIASIYGSVDLFILSSLEDNLPNTVMESLACGTPVVAFNTGGIPEMIDHQSTGWLAEYKSEKSIMEGIYWCLYKTDYSKLRENARQKVINNFNEKVISQQYIKLYKELLIQNHKSSF